jgi:hypothetical protein
MTRGELLVHCISYALIRARKIVRGLNQSLTQAERQAVANAVVDELRRHEDQWKLDGEIAEGRGSFDAEGMPKGY